MAENQCYDDVASTIFSYAQPYFTEPRPQPRVLWDFSCQNDWRLWLVGGNRAYWGWVSLGANAPVKEANSSNSILAHVVAVECRQFLKGWLR